MSHFYEIPKYVSCETTQARISVNMLYIKHGVKSLVLLEELLMCWHS